MRPRPRACKFNMAAIDRSQKRFSKGQFPTSFPNAPHELGKKVRNCGEKDTLWEQKECSWEEKEGGCDQQESAWEEKQPAWEREECS